MSFWKQNSIPKDASVCDSNNNNITVSLDFLRQQFPKTYVQYVRVFIRVYFRVCV